MRASYDPTLKLLCAVRDKLNSLQLSQENHHANIQGTVRKDTCMKGQGTSNQQTLPRMQAGSARPAVQHKPVEFRLPEDCGHVLPEIGLQWALEQRSDMKRGASAERGGASRDYTASMDTLDTSGSGISDIALTPKRSLHHTMEDQDQLVAVLVDFEGTCSVVAAAQCSDSQSGVEWCVTDHSTLDESIDAERQFDVVLLLCEPGQSERSLSTTVAKFGTLPHCVQRASSRVIVICVDSTPGAVASIGPPTLSLARSIGAREIFRLHVPFGDGRICTVLDSGQLDTSNVFCRISACLTQFHSPVKKPCYAHPRDRRGSSTSLNMLQLTLDLS